MPSAEELKIVIDATAEGAKKAINDLKGHFDGLGGKIGHAAKIGAEAMGAAGVAISGAMMKAVADTVKYGEAIDKVNKETGISTDQVQKFAYAAEQEHTSLDALEKGFGFLAKNMDAGKATFDELGIATKDAGGQLRNTGDVMLDLADYMSTETDETKKAAVAKQLLGRAGMEMVPFLSMGRAEIQRLGVEAGTLGIVLEDQTIRALEAFGDQVDKMKKSAKGLEMQIGNALLPAFSQATDAITNMFIGLQESGDLEGIFGNVAGLIEGLLPTFEGLFALVSSILESFGPVLTDVLGRVGEIFKELVDALIDSGLTDRLAELVELLANAFLDIFEAAMPLIEIFFGMFADVLQTLMPVIQVLTEALTGLVTAIVDAFTGGAASARQNIGLIEDAVDGLGEHWDDLSRKQREASIAQMESAKNVLEALKWPGWEESVKKLEEGIDKANLALDGNWKATEDWSKQEDKYFGEWETMTGNTLAEVSKKYQGFGKDLVKGGGQVSQEYIDTWRASTGNHRNAMEAFIHGGIDGMTSAWSGDKSKIEGIHEQLIFALSDPMGIFSSMSRSQMHDYLVGMFQQAGIDGKYVQDVEAWIVARLGLDGQAGPTGSGVGYEHGQGVRDGVNQWGPSIQWAIQNGLTVPAGNQGWLTGDEFGRNVYLRVMEWGQSIPPALRSFLVGIPGIHVGGLIEHMGGLIMHGGGQIAGLIRAHAGYLASDERPAILQAGEYVIRRSSVEKYGAATFDALNRGITPTGGVTIQKLYYQPNIPNVRTAADADAINAALDRKLRKVADSAVLQGGYAKR